jgi:hypothetical protein|tara:strand:- start:2999 stop:3937 length:939 start_codon:yes stop_codon:yes gene_type:complete
MKTTVEYFKKFHKEYIPVKGFIIIGVFLGLLIVTNYQLDIEDNFIDKLKPAALRIPAFFCLNAIAYFGVLFLLKFFRKDALIINLKTFAYAALGLLILSIDRSVFPYFVKPVLGLLDPQQFLFWYKIFFNAYGWITIFGILTLCKFLLDNKRSIGLYGLHFECINLKFYVILVALIIPLTALAALSSEINSFYPVYQRCGGYAFAVFHQLPEWISVLIYEFFYLTDFLNTELLFRGFLVIGVSKYLGKDAILPMVAAYAVLHFGKPVGETISSVFGGYLLGVLAFYSKNIWGGALVHVTLAGCVELFAYLLG